MFRTELKFFSQLKKEMSETLLHVRVRPNSFYTNIYGPRKTQNIDFWRFFNFLNFLENYSANLKFLGSIEITG